MLADLVSWAWARHQNELSWYVRPLFLLPLAWAAYRRSVLGILATLLALATSMAWFPAPAVPDPQVARFLAFERAWLRGPWPLGKLAVTALVPLALVAYCAAFWRRSVTTGAVLLGLIAVAKVGWALLAGDGGGAVIAPAGVGLALGVAGVLLARRVGHRRPVGAPRHASSSSSSPVTPARSRAAPRS